MEKIYCVKETYQMYDSDMWQFWGDTNILSYHATLEGAQAKQKMLIDKWIAELPEDIKRNEPYGPMDRCTTRYWKRETKRRKNNIILITNGTSKSGEEDRWRYIVEELIVEP